MKCLFFFLTLSLSTLTCLGQLKGFSVGPYVEYASPVGNFSETHRPGYGAGLGADVRLGRLGLTGSAGILYFRGSQVSTASEKPNASITAYPIRLGLKYRFLPFLYGKMETGNASLNRGEGQSLILSPGLGLRFLGLDLQVKYEAWRGNTHRNFWGFRAGYNF